MARAPGNGRVFLLDETSYRLINEVAFEGIPALDFSTPARDFQLHEDPQSTEEVIADGGLPAHEEALGMAALLQGPVVALDGPMLTIDLLEATAGDSHALFFRGSYCA